MSRAASARALGRRFPAGHGGEKGFALIESLIAFVVLAVGLGVLFSGVSTAMRADSRVISSRSAARVAQSLLEEAGISHKLVAGQREGTTGGAYKWHETITPIQIGAQQTEKPSMAPNQTTTAADLAAYWVEITVQTKDGTVANLAALKLTSQDTR
jgi:general secretion pathway protein I